jgi:L-aspartate oxidase
MPERHRLAELAPREVVAREIFNEQRRTGAVFLDARSMGERFVERFPGILALCLARGIDPRTDLIPVTPAAHYMMGGIDTDLAGHSRLPHLYACGEVSCTGVHGANRLASNSLLEGLVFAERIARDLAAVPRSTTPKRAGRWKVPELPDRGAAQVAADSIRALMWEKSGIERNARGLRECLEALTDIHERLPPGATEELNLCETAMLIARSAIERKESRGGHYRSDFPKPRQGWAKKHIEW